MKKIKSGELRAMLRGILERATPFLYYYRKASDGRFVRFVDWKRGAERRA